MGNLFSLPRVCDIFQNGSRKRKFIQQISSNDEEFDEPENKRYRLATDDTISALSVTKPDLILLAFNRRWPCHRSILCQSSFFQTLFNGSFRESKLREVELHMTDSSSDVINDVSFQKLLDIMYGREIVFVPEEIFAMTATSQYFQMESIVDFCEEKLAGMIRTSNAIEIYHFADRYFLTKTKETVFQWMLLRLFPVKCWDQLKALTLDLVKKLIAHPRLVTSNEMYLYCVLKMLIQIDLCGTCLQENEPFYSKIKSDAVPFLSTRDGRKFEGAFQALKLGNILVRRENVELIIADNIFPRNVIDEWIHKNWMSLISSEIPENFGPTADNVSKEDFETYAMRFAKIILQPNYHSWKFIGFSYAFDLALFFDGRTLIIKRVHQINEHKISYSHLLRNIMIRWDVTELNSVAVTRQASIHTITMTTNEEFCLKQLRKEPTYPCRVSIEVLFHVPYKPAQSNQTVTTSEGFSDGTLLKSSIKAKAFKSYKRIFN